MVQMNLRMHLTTGRTAQNLPWAARLQSADELCGCIRPQDLDGQPGKSVGREDSAPCLQFG